MAKTVSLEKTRMLEMAQKVRSGDVARATQVLEMLVDMRAKHYSGNVDALVARYFLVDIALRAHPDDVGRMLSWAQAVNTNGEKRRAKEAV